MNPTQFRTLKTRAQLSLKFRRWRSSRKIRVGPAPFAVKEAYSLKKSLVEEKHFTPAELGKVWGLSAETIRSIFEGEKGVLVIATPNGKRRYRTFRIPQSVAERVHTKLSA
jgi:hypothetical protein